MLRFRVQIVLCLVVLGSTRPAPAQAVDPAVSEVEAAVRGYETAYQNDPAKSVEFLAPDAKWIERGHPTAVQGASAWRSEADKAGARVTYNLHDFVTRVHGDVAWVTLSLDAIFTFADSDAGRRLMGRGTPDQHEWKGTFVESMVLVKIDGRWKIALGHSTDLGCKC